MQVLKAQLVLKVLVALKVLMVLRVSKVLREVQHLKVFKVFRELQEAAAEAAALDIGSRLELVLILFLMLVLRQPIPKLHYRLGKSMESRLD